MLCPQCKANSVTKNGTLNSVQKYKCKVCLYQFKLETKIPQQVKNKAVVLYNLGFSLPKIARMLRMSAVNVLNWVRKYQSNERRGFLLKPVRESKISNALVFEIEL